MLALCCILISMNRLKAEGRPKIMRCLCEGNSIRATSRLCDCAINTVVKIVVDLGAACQAYQEDNVRMLNARVVQVDELWSFVGCKQARATPDKKEKGHGDVWTWISIDADTKLVINWFMGNRGESAARDFMDDLADRLTKRIQLTSDGLNVYKDAVRLAFGKDIDYGMLIKEYGNETEGEKRYSPPICTGAHSKAIIGDPLESHISTSYVERQNLTVRMGCRRYTRLTNGYSKKLENHAAATAMHFMFYNYCRPHHTLTQDSGPKGERTQTTPAMAAGLTDHCWSVVEMIESVDRGIDLTRVGTDSK